MASSVSPKECGVCNEEFDEEKRCPRILFCSHGLCTQCIDQLIKNNTKQCPFCRKSFTANSVKDVMVNYPALEFMKYISLQDLSSKQAQKGQVLQRKKRLDDLKRKTRQISNYHLVNCQKARKQIEKALKEVINLQDNIKEENTRIQNDVLPKLHNVIHQNSRTVEVLDRTKRKLQNQLKEVKDKNKQLEKAKERVDSSAANTFRETDVVLDEAEGINSAIGGWVDDFNDLYSEEEKKLQTTEEKVKRTKEKINIILEVLSSEEETDEEEFETFSGMTAMAIQEDISLLQITAKELREMSDHTKCLVERRKIYAFHQHEGRRRSARISITEDGKVCLHHLTDKPLPLNVLVVEHGDVMRLVDPSSRLTFLDLGFVGGATLGRLYIRLNGDTKGAQHFLLLCTGKKGPSYAHTNILEVGNMGSDDEYVAGGDYESNDGGGGKALVDGLEKEIGGAYKRPWLAGTVVGMWWLLREAKAAQFLIYTRDIPGRERNPSIGRVEEGLSVLTEAISHYLNISDVSIKDCGIVLPF